MEHDEPLTFSQLGLPTPLRELVNLYEQQQTDAGHADQQREQTDHIKRLAAVRRWQGKN